MNKTTILNKAILLVVKSIINFLICIFIYHMIARFFGYHDYLIKYEKGYRAYPIIYKKEKEHLLLKWLESQEQVLESLF